MEARAAARAERAEREAKEKAVAEAKLRAEQEARDNEMNKEQLAAERLAEEKRYRATYARNRRGNGFPASIPIHRIRYGVHDQAPWLQVLPGDGVLMRDFPAPGYASWAVVARVDEFGFAVMRDLSHPVLVERAPPRWGWSPSSQASPARVFRTESPHEGRVQSASQFSVCSPSSQASPARVFRTESPHEGRVSTEYK